MITPRLPYSVDFRPIGRCNLQCPFCFGPRHTVATMSRRDALKVMDIIAGFGAKVVVLSGGEPTLLPYLPELLKRAKGSGLMTVLSTNGLLLEGVLPEIAPYLDWLALPLDGPDSASNGTMRIGDPDHFEKILGLLPRIRCEFPSLGVKLGTVVTRQNHTNVPQIIRNIGRDGLPDTWKLYQVSPSNYGRDNYGWLSVTDEVFEGTARRARRAAADYGVFCAVYRNRDRDGKYLFIDPTGDALVIDHCDEVRIGNIISDVASVVDVWPRFIDEERLMRNIDSTYGARGSCHA